MVATCKEEAKSKAAKDAVKKSRLATSFGM
jgi:hypothetical protein